MSREIKTSIFSKDKQPYVTQFEWPEGCFCQCGDRGIVISRSTGESYHTAFFEAFPRTPDTFIRGEGATIAEAEADAWATYQSQIACTEHEMERRDYDNGAGFCKKCGMFESNAFPPIFYPCPQCSRETRFKQDAKGVYWCIDCSPNIPEEDKGFMDKMFEEMDQSAWLTKYKSKYPDKF